MAADCSLTSISPIPVSYTHLKGFEWIGAYDITADELLAGTDSGKTESKTAQAQMLILEDVYKRQILFNELVLSDKLFEHCAEIDEAARNRMELIVRSLAEQNGVTEQLLSLIHICVIIWRAKRDSNPRPSP